MRSPMMGVAAFLPEGVERLIVGRAAGVVFGAFDGAEGAA